jgi:hypothetical protein
VRAGRPQTTSGSAIRIGPDFRHPFVIKDMRIWKVHYAFRPESPSVLVDGMTIYRADYGVYNPNYDHHVYRNIRLSAHPARIFSELPLS